MFRIAIVSVAAALATADPMYIPRMSPVELNPFTPQGRIVGGRETTIEELPWQVSIQVLGFHFCGGSIISKNVILTAGHCTVSYPAESMKVRIGSSKAASGGVLHEVAEIVRHENYKTSLLGIPRNDIAVLKLKASIEFSDSAQPVPLYDVNEVTIEGVSSTISGWGAMEEGGSTIDVLRTVDIPTVSKKDCSNAYWVMGGIPEGQICAASPDGGKDTCQGDSGGPLVIAGRQAGIVSWGMGCARKKYPGVYTEVAALRDWIKKNAGV